MDDVNARLKSLTECSAVPVVGFIPARQFFECLAHRRFPTTVTVRPKEQLDYLPEPDIFHDVFGHVPLHADPVFAEFLQRFGSVAARARSEEAIEQMARLFWFTVEFGLVQEEGEIKVYGSGLISSAGDAANALSDRCDRRPFLARGGDQTALRDRPVSGCALHRGLVRPALRRGRGTRAARLLSERARPALARPGARSPARPPRT